MNNKQRITIISLATVSLMLTASVVLTVAWYDGASHLAVSNVNVSLLDKELSISTDNITFKQYLSTDDLAETTVFKAVSSQFSDNWISQKKDKPEFYGVYSYSNNDSSNDNQPKLLESGYFTQELYIKCNSAVYVTFDAENTTFLPDEEDNEKLLHESNAKLHEFFPGLTDEEILHNLNACVKSLRLSLLVLDDEDDESGTYPDYNYYIIDPYKEQKTYLAGILDSDKNGYYDYSKEDKEILYGEAYSSVEGKTVEECLAYHEPNQTSTEVGEKHLTCFTSGNKQGVSKINFEQSFENGLVLKEEPSISSSEMENKVLIPLRPNTSKRIVLSFYQEGWDKDNTDFVRFSHFFVNVLFKIAKTKF